MQDGKGTALGGTNARIGMQARSQSPAGSMTDEVKLLFLEALARRRTVKSACEETGLTRWQATRERAADPAFDQLWSEAIENIADELEAEAMRRAMQGYELRTTVRRREKKETRSGEDSGNGATSGETEGEMESVAHRYSEGLLILLLKANRPAKFGGRLVASEGNIEGEISQDRDPPLVERGRVA